MGRRIDADGLVGAAEIADRLGLAHAEGVHTWRRRHADFPEPVARLRQAMIWYWPDVEKWAHSNGRDRGLMKPGRRVRKHA